MNIRKFAKNNAILAKMFYAARNTVYSLNLRKYRNREIQNDLILFNNFNGRGYGDNPKAIAEVFHQLYPEFRLAWAYAKQSDCDTLPAYIHPVKFQSQEYFETMAVSKVWVFNVLPPSGALKRKEQIYVQTWHGDRPIKKILKDAALDSVRYQKTSGHGDTEKRLCDYFVSGSSWFSNVWRRTADYDGEILEYGMPRNDCLLHTETEENQNRKNRFKERYHIPSEAKVLLYAPTFRDHALDEETIENQPDLQGILDRLKAKYQCEWVCVIRGHGGRRLRAKEGVCIDVTACADMADVLLSSDFLITDYSSCAGDFALLHKPVILYQEDIHDYTEKDRTLYFEMSETPYLIVHDMPALYNLLESLNEETVYQNCEDILSFYKVKESGNSGETVCRIIAEKMTESTHGTERH